jgi:hypothetical protein
VLALAAGCGLLVRIPAIAEPLGIDQSLWASAVRGMSRGLVLYRDVWDHKPPGIFLAYLAAFRAFGWTPSSIAWLDLAASAITTMLVFEIVRRAAHASMAAVAAALYAVFTIPSWLYGNGGFLERSVAETFIVVAVGAAARCAVRLTRRSSAAAALGLGFAVGVAIVFKPNAAIYLPALWVWVAAYGGLSRRALVTLGVVAVIGSCVAPILTLLWLWRAGVLHDTWLALVVFNRFYLADGFTPSQASSAFANAIGLRMKTDPLWAAGGIGALVVAWDLARTRRLDAAAALPVVWGAAAAIAIFANGVRLFNTYFIQALAPLAMLAAWVIWGAARRSIVHRAAATAVIVIGVAVLAQRHFVARVVDTTRADLDALSDASQRAGYLERFGGYATGRGYSARANDELFTYVREHTSRDDRIYQFGINGSAVYFAADRLPAQRFLRITAFLPPTLPDPGFARATVLDELERARPVYLIFEQLHRTSAPEVAMSVDSLPQDPDVARLLESYVLEARIEDFTLYRRR